MSAKLEERTVFKEVRVTHRLMAQTLGPKLIKRLEENWSRDVLSSLKSFDTMMTNMEWNDGQIDVLQSVRDFFSWDGGPTKKKRIDREEAKTLVAKLRSMLFDSVAIVYQIPEVQPSEAVRVKLPNRLIESLFCIHNNKELIYHHDQLRNLFRPSTKKRPAKELKLEWPYHMRKKMKADGVTYTSFERKTIAAAIYDSAAHSKTMKLGNEVEQEGTNALLVEEYMKLMWNCCSENYDHDNTELAYRFYFLASQTWSPIGEVSQDNRFYLPGDYADYVQSPHVDYSPTRNLRVNEQYHQDMWSMDLPLTEEGCTVMIWPKEGIGIACHAKYNEVILRCPRLVHSGGLPGRNNGHAFRLHGAIGTTKYLAEIDGQAQTYKKDGNNKEYRTTHAFPDAAQVIQAVHDQYI
jgi:hypothetical protein